MPECYEFEECEYNGQPRCYLPDGVDCPHGVGAGANEGGHLMDIEKLAERLGQEAYGSDIEDLLLEVATALSTLQVENEKLRAELERMKTIMQNNGIMTIPSKYPGGPSEWNIPKPHVQKEG